MCNSIPSNQKKNYFLRTTFSISEPLILSGPRQAAFGSSEACPIVSRKNHASWPVYAESPFEMPPNNNWGCVSSDRDCCPDSCWSTPGIVSLLNCGQSDAASSWCSKARLRSPCPLQKQQAHSSQSSSASAIVWGVIYPCKYLTNFGFPYTALSLIFADNETCITWSEDSVSSAEHIDLLVNFPT